ncbi:MAG: hypothetical protein ABIA37_05535, partial [Candidatus Woesearchaeota archaeon]
ANQRFVKITNESAAYRKEAVEAKKAFTPESYAKYEMSGDRKDLIKRTKETEKTSVFEEKIQKIVEQNPGVSEQEATALVTGTLQLVKDDVSGNRYLVDKLTGTEKLITPTTKNQDADPDKNQDADPEPEGENPGDTMWGASEKGTGLFSAVMSGLSTVSGMAGGPIDKETVQSRQLLFSAQRDFIRALSLNPRYPVAEQNRIKEEVKLEPRIFDSAKTFKARAVTIDKYLRTKLKEEERASSDPYLPVNERRDARISARAISNFIDTLGVPPTVTTDEQYKELLVGDEFFDDKGKHRKKTEHKEAK